MAEAPASPGGGSHESGEQSPRSNVREQDRFLPIANISRIMKKALPANGKIAKDAKETVQECVSEFISFITSEASDKCQREKRKTINGDDLLWAMATLGFEDYIEPLKVYLSRYREMEVSLPILLSCSGFNVHFPRIFETMGDTKGSAKGGETSGRKDAMMGQPVSNVQVSHQGSFSQAMNYGNSQSLNAVTSSSAPPCRIKLLLAMVEDPSTDYEADHVDPKVWKFDC
ncbi:Nuclear transcription factor Y subunit B-10 [Ancistrocladus abbreviatus]